MKTLEQKKAEQFPVKSGMGLQVKDIDMSKRMVTGYFNSFNYFDSDADVILPGAFKKSISERGPESSAPAKIKHALFHDLSRLPGKLMKLEEDATGLYFETKMSSTQEGNDTLINYQEKIYDNHSIGFRYLDAEYIDAKSKTWEKIISTLVNRSEAESNGYLIAVKEVKLWEGSTVAFGANQMTPYLGSKSMNKEAITIKLFERMDLFEKQLKSGTQSDDMMLDFEIQVRQIKQLINEIITLQPEDKTTLKEAGKNEVEKVDVSKIINNFKFIQNG
jgi:HK97 family phage prohead protease